GVKPQHRSSQLPLPGAEQRSLPIFLCDSGGKTRTKDKYRVVYTDHQRMELEKEFQFNRYITMRRKSELSMALSLSERQVKIWFQNRRAKERKINRKKLQHSQQASTTTPTPPVLEVLNSYKTTCACVTSYEMMHLYPVKKKYF
uniref:Caudal type homeobox 1a n=1 Tax=Amphilophus citrinellus TaxID=61819 RepID=A0A3Q0SCS7_AMPCI